MKNEENIEENNKLDEKDLESGDDMVREPSRYYRTRREAETNRRRGERIYYRAGKGYYIRRPQQKKSFWEVFLGR